MIMRSDYVNFVQVQITCQLLW